VIWPKTDYFVHFYQERYLLDDFCLSRIESSLNSIKNVRTQTLKLAIRQNQLTLDHVMNFLKLYVFGKKIARADNNNNKNNGSQTF
jgi:hypothetical protein